MGKMKELFMKINYPNGDYDIEREYLFDDVLAQERQYYEEQELLKNQNPLLTTKIEVANDGIRRTTRIEIGEQKQEADLQTKGG